jgi:hypothetical protein
MPKSYSQVSRQEELNFESMRAELERIQEQIATGRYERSPLFPKVIDGKRQYPGEPAGAYLASYLEHAAPSVRKRLLAWMLPLSRFSEAVRSKNIKAIDEARRRCKVSLDHMARAVMDKKWEFAGIVSDGLLLRPATPEGKAAFAGVSLFDVYQLHHVRRCQRCHSWFYARFKHQMFCNDPSKRCQWKHYHTPAWRRLQRERNRKHQREYRKRLFGKGGNN